MKLLRKLKLNRVDLVPKGANPHARISLAKADTRDEDGEQFPAGDYAFVPDEDNPETWKLRLTAEPGGPPDPGMVDQAIEVIASDQFSDDELPGVKAKILAAWAELNPDEDPPDVLKESDDMPDETPETPDVDKITSERDALRAELEKVQKAAEEGETEIRKQLDDVLERERQREFIAKAEAYASLGSVERIAGLLGAADKHFGDVEKADLGALLKGAAEQVSKGHLFSQLSDPAEPEKKGWKDRLDERARDLVAKGVEPTIEQAKVRAMHDNAELRTEYQKQARSR